MVHTCNRCKKTFTQRAHYNFHMNRKFPCQQIQEELPKVEVQNDKKPDTKLQCTHCLKVLSRADALQRHLNVCRVKRINDTGNNRTEVVLKMVQACENENKLLYEDNIKYKQHIAELEAEKQKYLKIIQMLTA